MSAGSLVFLYPEKQEYLEGNSLGCSGVGEAWFPFHLRDKLPQKGILQNVRRVSDASETQAFEYRRKTWTKGNLRILSQRSCGYERSHRGHLGNLMERDREGQETGRQQNGRKFGVLSRLLAKPSMPLRGHFWGSPICIGARPFGGSNFSSF